MTVRTKNLLFALFLLILMLGMLAWYIFAKPLPKLPAAATSTPATATSATPTIFSATPAHIIEHGQYYDSDLQYPSATPLITSANIAANNGAVQLMKAFAQTTLVTFKKDGQFDSLTSADAKIQGLDQGRKYTLTDNYTSYYGTHTISYAFNIYEDTLGAHPNTYFHTFTFDSKTGNNLALSDLFNPSSDYLNQLSSLSRAALTKTEGADADAMSINNGTTPTLDSFQNFAIDGSDLVIIFPPYQVAAYSLGTQTVRIPLTELKNILKSEYQ